MTLEQIIEKLENPPRHEMELMAQKIGKELKPICQKDIKKIINRCISDFYHTYKPKYHKRSYSLRYMYKIKATSDCITINYSPRFTTVRHRAPKSYIFDIVFMQGYHGGATDISASKIQKWGEHPDPGTPYWRTPHPEYTSWGIPAKQDESPRNRIRDALNEYQNGKLQEHQVEIIKKQYIAYINKLFKSLK